MRLAFHTGAALALGLFPLTALAGDPEAGAEAFQRQCSNCHMVQNEAGETLAGRNARQGPNLYGVIGRQAGIVDGFRYGASMVEAGEAGLVWDEPSVLAYLQNPNGFLREVLGNNLARGQMAFQVRSETDAADLYAFLATFSPATEGEDDEENGEAAAD